MSGDWKDIPTHLTFSAEEIERLRNLTLVERWKEYLDEKETQLKAAIHHLYGASP